MGNVKEIASSDENLNETLERIFKNIDASKECVKDTREQVLRDEIAKIIAEIEVGV